MAQNQNRIEVTLSLRDLASKGLRDFGSEVKRTGRVVERETRETGDDFDRLEDEVRRETKKAEKSVERFSRGARSELRKVDRATKTSGSAFGAFAKRTLVALAGIESARRTIGLGFGFVSDAAAAEETLNRFGVVFGNQAAAAEAQVQQLSATLGRSTGALRDYSSQYQNLLTALGLTREESADLSLELTKLQLDIASFQDLTDQEVATRLFSGLVGEAEAVRRFGVDLSQAAIEAEAFRLGIEGGAQELTQQQKVLIRTSLLFKNTADAQGDLIRTQDSFQNQIKRLNGRLQEFRVILGQEVIAVIQEAVEELGGIDAVAERIGQGFRAAAIFTVTSIELTRQAIDAVDRYVEAAGGIEGVFERGADGIGLIIEQSQEGVARIGLVATTVFNTIAGVSDAALIALNSVSTEIDGIANKVKNELNPIATATRGLDALVNVFPVDTPSRGPADDPERAAASAASRGGSRSVADVIRETAAANQKALDEYQKLVAGSEASGDRIRASIASIGESFNDLVTKFREASAGAADVGTQTDQAAERTREVLGSLEGLFGDLGATSDATAGSLGGIPRELYAIAEAARIAAIEGKAYSDALAFQEETAGGRAALERAKEYRLELERQADAGAGADAAIERYGQSLSNFALAGDLVTGVFGALENGAQSFARSLVDSSRSSSDAVKGLVQDIAALAIQFAILRSLRGAFGFGATGQATGGGVGGFLSGLLGGVPQKAMGGVMAGPVIGTAPLPVRAYEKGGVATSPQLAIFGEGRTNEAFVPLPDGKRIPVDMRNGGGGQPIELNLRVESIDPTKAAETVLRSMPEIEAALASAIASGSNRQLKAAIQGA